ncbi:MAG TPA: transposase [Candidatus Saccharimonadales bacterium]|nr:transposase [Candidatus Saccharimonadales bacterium]
MKLYHVMSAIVNQLSLEVRVRRVLKDFALGILASRSCQLEAVAQALEPRGSEVGQYRRLQRFLANEHVAVASLQTEWAALVVKAMQAQQVVLLVDETALSDHLKVMVLGIWSRGGCVPLAWRCYAPDAYPVEGQVQLIRDLLARVESVVPVNLPLWLLADRGIGTSPALLQAAEALGCQVLFRVQGSTRFRASDGQEQSLQSLGIRGQSWQSVGEVFKKAGWLPAHVTVTWDADCAQPWCLVSSRPVAPHAYGVRFDQEVSFRDLKSDGFDWQRSHVWIAEHAERLLLVLALSYWLVLTLGQRLTPPLTGRASRWSAFRRGKEALAALFRPTIAPLLPPPDFLTCVVQ